MNFAPYCSATLPQREHGDFRWNEKAHWEHAGADAAGHIQVPPVFDNVAVRVALAVVRRHDAAPEQRQPHLAAMRVTRQRERRRHAEARKRLEHDRLVRIELRSLAHALVDAAADATPSATSPLVSDGSAHQRVLEDFLRAIEDGAAPACDGREGRKSVELVTAIYTSAREARLVYPRR